MAESSNAADTPPAQRSSAGSEQPGDTQAASQPHSEQLQHDSHTWDFLSPVASMPSPAGNTEQGHGLLQPLSPSYDDSSVTSDTTEGANEAAARVAARFGELDAVSSLPPSAASAAAARIPSGSRSRSRSRSRERSDEAPSSGPHTALLRALREQAASLAAEQEALQSHQRQQQRQRQGLASALSQARERREQAETEQRGASLDFSIGARPLRASPGGSIELRGEAPPRPVQQSLFASDRTMELLSAAGIPTGELRGILRAAGAGSELPLPPNVQRSAGPPPPEDAANWKQRAKELRNLCSPVPGPDQTDQLEVVRGHVTFLADVANAEPPSSWDSSSLLKDMGDILGETLYQKLLGPSNTSAAVLLEASRLYWYFTRSNTNKPQMLQRANLDSVLETLRVSAALPDVQFNIIVGLSNLALSRAGSHTFMRSASKQLPRLMAAACGAHETHMELQLAACILIGHVLNHTWEDWEPEPEAGHTESPAPVTKEELATQFVASGCHMSILRLMTATPLEHRLLHSALGGAVMLLTEAPACAGDLLSTGVVAVALDCFKRFCPERRTHPRPWLLFVDMLDRMLKADTEGFRHAILEMPKAADTLISCLELCEGGVQQLQPHLLEGLYAALRKMDREAVVELLPRVRHAAPLLRLVEDKPRPDVGPGSDASHAAILRRVLQVCFNGQQRSTVAKSTTVRMLSEQLYAFRDVSSIVEPLMGIAWLLCFVDSFKSDVKDDKHNILTRLQLIHADMPSNGAVQERFAAIRAMCKLGGGGGAGYGW